MIKVAIAGGDTLEAGELIRILVNHPDVELKDITAPGKEGHALSSVHHGLIGESNMKFTQSIDLRKCDVLFVTGGSMTAPQMAALLESNPDLKIIVLSHPNDIKDDKSFVYGIPEINRKALVRGARAAIIPRPAASLALVSLFPLAHHLLLRKSLNLKLWGPEDIIMPEEMEAARDEIFDQLREVQLSFSHNVDVKPVHGHSRRGMMIETEIECDLDLEHLMQLYDIYDDHHFAFAVTTPITISETIGTDRVVISLQKPSPGTLRLTSVADGRMRGAAGEAVHVMNLMCGLHEKTGLALKASYY